MDSSVLSALLTGSGVAGAFCVLFIIGQVLPKGVVADLKAEMAELKAAQEKERDRADMATAALISSRDVISSLQIGLAASGKGFPCAACPMVPAGGIMGMAITKPVRPGQQGELPPAQGGTPSGGAGDPGSGHASQD